MSWSWVQDGSKIMIKFNIVIVYHWMENALRQDPKAWKVKRTLFVVTKHNMQISW